MMAGIASMPTERGETSLDAAMRAPSIQAPEVVVLDFVNTVEKPKKEIPDPRKDLWLTTFDGLVISFDRYTRVIRLRGSPLGVHITVTLRALDGGFLEAEQQTIDLPEEDPAIFSFVVAYLYEEKFVPIKPVASVLVQDLDKGKGKEHDGENTGSDDGTDSGTGLSDDTTRNRRRRARRRRRQEREWNQRLRKTPGRHRPDCSCVACTTEELRTRCWNCGQSRQPPAPPRWGGRPLPPPPPPHPPRGLLPPAARVPVPPYEREHRRGSQAEYAVSNDERMTQEDLRTWSLAYSLSIDVYVCAERYLLRDFKACIAAYIINHFEIAGLDAANSSVLSSCKVLSAGLSPMDPLLKKVFARVGFLQAQLWKRVPEFTSNFFTENPELAMLIMKEMVERREEDHRGDLPAMERSNLSRDDDAPRRPYHPHRHPGGRYIPLADD